MVINGRFGLCNRRNRGCDGRSGDVLGSCIQLGLLVELPVDILLRAVARDVAGLATLIAGLAGGVQGPAVGSGAVAGDVTQFTTSIAFHSLGLAVPSKMVRPAALVARSRAGPAGESAAAAVAVAVGGTGDRAATTKTDSSGGRASTLQVKSVLDR